MNTSLHKKLFFSMLRIRMIEETIAKRYPQQEMRCPVHFSIGQEAIAVGVLQNLKSCDHMLSTHRAHAHYLAKGGNLKKLIAELYGKATGCTSGLGGSMHLVDLDVNMLGSTPIVGGSIPVAVGAALTSKMKNAKQISVVFFGDGATEEGVFAESMNFAALKKLPVLFVCENNLYSVYSPLKVRQPENASRLAIAKAHGLNVGSANGNKVDQVYELASRNIINIREGLGPAYLEFSSYRWLEHCGPNFDNKIGYRTEEEFLYWKEQCPIRYSEKLLLKNHILTQTEIDKTKTEVKNEIEAAFLFAHDSPDPEKHSLEQKVYHKSMPSKEPSSSDRNISYAEAIREATDQCMEKDENVFIMGLGVPDPKGIFGTTLGLEGKYGSRRVMDTPTAENGITGIAIGSAITGMRPILTHQRMDFSLLSLDQIINNAAKWHYMFSAQMCVPLVIRMIIGRGWGQGPQHAQNLQTLFAHIPGLKVVAPSNACDAKGLLVAAIKDNNPVIYLEHRWLHNVTGQVPQGLYEVPIGPTHTVVEGNHITIIACSYMAIEAIQAANILKGFNIHAEVIDVRTLRPLDTKSIIRSVKKTGYIVVADLSWKEMGLAGEIIASVCEEAFHDLKAPPKRITFPDSPTPTSPYLANEFYPRTPDIVNACFETLGLPPKSDQELGLESGKPSDVPNKDFLGPF
jgi:2-oxoisovalerate dehydrogenase E1 component